MKQRHGIHSHLLVPLLAAVFLLVVPDRGHCQSSWGGYPGGYGVAQDDEGAKKVKTYEVHASVAAQSGVVVPGGKRSPTSLRILVGANVFKLDIPKLGGKVLTGPFVSVPFSIEMGWGEKIVQVAPALGWEFSGRPSKHWKWTFDILLSVALTGKVDGKKGLRAAGPGIAFGAVYYFLAGFGLFGEVNVETYFGSTNAMTAGASAGLVLTWEIFKVKKPKAAE